MMIWLVQSSGVEQVKRICLSIAALAALTAGQAFAADLPPAPPVYKAPAAYVPVEPPCMWCGFYVGAYAGYGWGNSDATGTLDPTSAFGNAPPVAQPAYNANMSPTLKPNGFTGGGTIGGNWQTGSLVFGAEGDFGYSGLSDTVTTTVAPPGHVALTSITKVNTNWVATLRARAGWAFGPVLVYVTGGGAATDLNFNQNNTYATLGPTGIENTSFSNTKFGWTAGGGLEYMFSRNWTAKAEYLYMDFGSISGTGIVPIQPVTVSHSANLTVNLARAGVNYKF